MRDTGRRDDGFGAAVGGGHGLLGGARPGTADARARLEALWMTEDDIVDREAELVVLRGEPARSLADLADNRHADLVVIGAHRGGVHPDVCERLLRISARPVVVVP
jgi:nucleotide-binding universal stress UspA family protein